MECKDIIEMHVLNSGRSKEELTSTRQLLKYQRRLEVFTINGSKAVEYDDPI